MKLVVSAEKGEPDDAVPPRPDDLENDADYVMETWLQHRIHHTYPEPGGYNDQDETLMRDWKTMNLWHLRVSAGYTLYDDIDLMPVPPNVLNLMHD